MFVHSVRRHFSGWLLAAAAALTGCTQGSVPSSSADLDALKPEVRARQTQERENSPATLPGWSADDLQGLADAISQQCKMRKPPQPWPQLCQEFKRLAPDGLRRWLEHRFSASPMVAEDGKKTGLITGYYEPELHGSRSRIHGSQVALYKKPSSDILAAKPSREQIENSDLLLGAELIWVDDPVEAFFLQVQGSGKIRLKEGGSVRVGYAGDNGHRYKAIGQVLIERGEIPATQMSARAIKDWLRSNPGQASEVMQQNPRYVFFRELKGLSSSSGPLGSLGVPITAGRSVAVDRKYIPPGSLLYLDTRDPISGKPLRRTVVAQDSGGAIIGPLRVDLFWGSGEKAGEAAGKMKHTGRLWRLQPRSEL